MIKARGSRPKVLMLTPWPPHHFDGGSKRIHWVEPPSGQDPERMKGVWLPPEPRRRYTAAMAERLREEIGAGGRRLACAKFDWHSRAEKPDRLHDERLAPR